MDVKGKKHALIVASEGQVDQLFWKAFLGRYLSRRKVAVKWKCFEGMQRIHRNANSLTPLVRDLGSSGYTVTLVACLDGDLFQGGQLPYTVEQLRDKLGRLGVAQVLMLVPNQTIEDWMALDIEGLLSYAGLSSSSGLPRHYPGLPLLRAIYRRSGNVYLKKQRDAQRLVEALDMDKIERELLKSGGCPDLHKLLQLLK